MGRSGQTYDVAPSLATYLLTTHCAELADDGHAVIVPEREPRLRTLTDSRERIHAGRVRVPLLRSVLWHARHVLAHNVRVVLILLYIRLPRVIVGIRRALRRADVILKHLGVGVL